MTGFVFFRKKVYIYIYIYIYILVERIRGWPEGSLFFRVEQLFSLNCFTYHWSIPLNDLLIKKTSSTFFLNLWLDLAIGEHSNNYAKWINELGISLSAGRSLLLCLLRSYTNISEQVICPWFWLNSWPELSWIITLFSLDFFYFHALEYYYVYNNVIRSKNKNKTRLLI